MHPDVLAHLQRQFLDREFPVSFRSPLESSSDVAPGERTRLCSRCACGQCCFTMSVAECSVRAVRCHCALCRRYHAAPFAALLAFSDLFAGQAASRELEDLKKLRRWRESCAHLGEVDRIFCGECFSVMATQSVRAEEEIYLAMGTVADDSIPSSWALRWQKPDEAWCAQDATPLWSAVPLASRNEPNFEPHKQVVSGGCSCGGCAFVARVLPGELQHCYCGLCRKFSGSVAQTWVPCHNDGWQWTCRDTLELRRTSSHGQRHVCTFCGTTLTIVYDSQPGVTWPAAGCFEDALPPANLLNQQVYRVVHICCEFMQEWYQLPDDGLPRLRYAG